MITLSMRLFAEQPNKARFMDTVRGMLEPIRAETDCMGYWLCGDVEDDRRLFLIQEWRDESAFRRHIHGHAFRTLLVSLDLLSRAPSISVTRAQDRVDLTDISDLYENTC